MSIDIAVIDISSPISVMNSRNGSGRGAAVSSGMRVSGAFKLACVQMAAGHRGLSSKRPASLYTRCGPLCHPKLIAAIPPLP
jgi:hypothetical protein